MAEQLRRSGRREQARAVLRRVLQREPDHPAANQCMALICAEEGAQDQSLYFIDRAARAAPGSAQIQLAAGLLRRNGPDWESAAAALRRAVEIQPDLADGWRALGGLLCAQMRHEEAEGPLRRALELTPGADDAAGNLARVLVETGRSSEVEALLNARPAPLPPSLLGQRAYALNYIDADRQAAFEAHATFARSLAPTPPPAPPATAEPERKLRIGYLSPDLRRHSVMRFLEPLLAHHDRAAFEVFAYHTGGREDETTRRVREMVHTFRAVFPARPEAIGGAVMSDRIDILVDLAGLTSTPQLGALAQRAAPVQVHYMGYPNSVGVADARFVDARTDPPGAERWSQERLVRLEGCFLCFAPPERAPEPVMPRGPGVVFGSFNSVAKLSDRCVHLWSRVLQAVPGSRLMLKSAGFRGPQTLARARARFASAGIDPARVECLSWVDDEGGHLGAYGRVDVALDTVPYNGATTTCEALWMGVPVVTLEGDRHVARVGSSLLAAAALPEMIAPDEAAFVRIAAELAADRARREELRRTLRGRLVSSRLCDAPAHARALESALRALWRDWCAGRGAV